MAIYAIITIRGEALEYSILILEDNETRLLGFLRALSDTGSPLKVKVWNDAHTMMAEVDQYINDACVISLDHDLYPTDVDHDDPGDGLDVARYLATFDPACPVIIHSSNADRSRVMQGELELAGWTCTMVGPFGEGWVEKDWLPVVLRAVAAG